MGLALGMALKLYINVANSWIYKSDIFRANSYVCRSNRQKTGRGPFGPPLPTLNSAKSRSKCNTAAFVKRFFFFTKKLAFLEFSRTFKEVRTTKKIFRQSWTKYL